VPRKERTPEEKQKLLIRELRKRALKEPPRGKIHAYIAFAKEVMTGSSTTLAEGQSRMKEAAAKFRGLNAAEREVRLTLPSLPLMPHRATLSAHAEECTDRST
jgi:hypothetical protein